jgi:hypothetical protein
MLTFIPCNKINMSSLNTKNIIIGLLALLAIGGAVYYFFFNNSAPTVVTDSLAPSATELASQDIIVMVEKLKTVSIESSLFSEPIFTSLRDFSVPLLQENQGRLNPFSRIGIELPGAIPSVPTFTNGTGSGSSNPGS